MWQLEYGNPRHTPQSAGQHTGQTLIRARCRASGGGGQQAAAAARGAADAVESAGADGRTCHVEGCQGGLTVHSLTEGTHLRRPLSDGCQEACEAHMAPEAPMCCVSSKMRSLRALCHLAQKLFGALRHCRDLDMQGCIQLNGSVFASLAGTAATLTTLNCEDIDLVGLTAEDSSLCHCACSAAVSMRRCHTAADGVRRPMNGRRCD